MSASAPSVTSDLVAFVLARLDDEDRDLDRTTTDAADRERRATDVHARRQVVASVQELLGLPDQPNEKAVRDLAVSILRSLATPFAGHPDFREEWHAATR